MLIMSRLLRSVGFVVFDLLALFMLVLPCVDFTFDVDLLVM